MDARGRAGSPALAATDTHKIRLSNGRWGGIERDGLQWATIFVILLQYLKAIWLARMLIAQIVNQKIHTTAAADPHIDDALRRLLMAQPAAAVRANDERRIP